MTLTTASGPIPMGVSYTCYDVTGNTATEIRASINASPARFKNPDGTLSDANTKWNYRVSWTYALSGGACQATSVTPTLSVAFTFARWVAPSAPDPAVVAKWNAYVVAVQTHENGHQQNGINTTSDAVTRVRAVSVATCTDFSAAAQAALDQATAAGSAADIQYDATTRHGATQGAVFP